MPNPFASSALVATLKKNPMLVAVGLGGVGLAAFLTTRGGGGAAEPPPTDTTDPNASDLMGTDAGSGSPYDSGPGGGYYDPFGGSGTDPYGGQPPDPGTTADGCSWPPPSIPAGYEGRGSWSCDNGQWTWNWIDQPPPPGPGPGPVPPPPGGTNAKGCPLPKPTLPPGMVGSHKYECRHKRWVLVKLDGSTPPPTPGATPNVSKGRHTSYAGHKNARNKLVLSDPRPFTLAKAEHWDLSPGESGDRTPGKHGGEIKVRQIKTAKGHAGLVGRWLA